MANNQTLPKPSGFGKTSRVDSWWMQPVAVFLCLSLFIVYATWAALQNAYYWTGPYVSPFYSPELFGASPHSIFGPIPGWWPSWLPFSPALIILPFPALFRFTCYYYRGAYYKAFTADPPACGVSESRKRYAGENSFPLLMQNVHRYFMYFALLFLVFLWIDVFQAFVFTDAAGQAGFGIGVGTLVLLVSTVLLSGYTFGCHSLRHLVGGRVDCLSKHKTQMACYSCVGSLNKRHMLWAWMSLFGVMLADLYVRLVAMGFLHDWRII